MYLQKTAMLFPIPLGGAHSIPPAADSHLSRESVFGKWVQLSAEPNILCVSNVLSSTNEQGLEPCNLFFGETTTSIFQ